MFKRFSTSYMVFLYIMNLILTEGALYAASVLRFRLPYGDRVPWEMARVPLPVYGLVALIWTLIFMVLSFASKYAQRGYGCGTGRPETGSLVIGQSADTPGVDGGARGGGWLIHPRFGKVSDRSRGLGQRPSPNLS